ncbi:BT4734/BF3469 family protein [Mongoliitalea lutea]|uniref:BT4734-like N-terminal domain-containing protein n=1 Tax=Mongoliitalea lutea TaxID=849756 RepID=A0A8J3G6F6_9BACT|nr:BT4734/BF3469 family protein [Mongoliitalea lutea]GHB45656.1 hypothetical protein GCM10008106_28360 [Mongoliitalea lutea]
MKSILDIEVSCFKDYEETAHPKTVNLLSWLTSTKYKDKVDLIRTLDDKKERDAIKSTLPAITPSAILKNRKRGIPLMEKLVKHSGFIQIDIDKSKNNLGISNWDDLKAELCKLPNIAYFGLSASGRGFWGLIPIPPEPENHKRYFDSLEKIFLGWGIELDGQPKNIASLRGYSYDLEPYFNHQAVQFTKMIQTYPVPQVTPPPLKTPVSDGYFAWLENWILKRISEAVEGKRHAKRLEYSRLAGGLIAGGYLPHTMEETIISAYLSQYGGHDAKDVQDREIRTIREGIADGLKAPIHPDLKCLFVPFTDIQDYSDKAFKIWQGDDHFYIPKSTVFEILDFGFYVSENFLMMAESKPPAYQENAWKKFRIDTVCVYQVPQKKTLITENDDTQADIDRLESEIKSVSYKIRKTIQEIRKRNKENQRLRNEIADCEISEKAILANKELLKRYRLESSLIQ